MRAGIAVLSILTRGDERKGVLRGLAPMLDGLPCELWILICRMQSLVANFFWRRAELLEQPRGRKYRLRLVDA